MEDGSSAQAPSCILYPPSSLSLALRALRASVVIPFLGIQALRINLPAIPCYAVLIGILSDTHDRAAAMAAGVDALRAAGVDYYIHCGDVGGEAMLDYLAGEAAAFVWGNTDWDRVRLQRYAEQLGVTCFGAFGELEFGGRRIALTHGDDTRLVKKIVDEQKHDYLLMGHTHVKADALVGHTRIINPGALHRTREKTVAVLDLNHDELEFLPVIV